MEKSKMKKINQKEERSLRNDRIKRIKNEGNEVESDGRRNRDTVRWRKDNGTERHKKVGIKQQKR